MKAAFVLSSLATTATCAPIGAYALTRESIQEKVNKYCLKESTPLDIWKVAEEKLKKESSINDPFQDIYKKLKENSYQNTGKDLRDFCIDLYSQDSSSIFKKENKSLIDQVKKYCGLKIREKLGSSNAFPDSGEDDLIQQKITFLEDHSDERGILTQKLIDIKESSKTDKKSAFREACKEIYETPFFSESSNIWKVAENYCKKGPTQ